MLLFKLIIGFLQRHYDYDSYVHLKISVSQYYTLNFAPLLVLWSRYVSVYSYLKNTNRDFTI